MDRIPEPSILDPARVQHDGGSQGVTDHNPTREELATDLREVCDYALQLWNELDATRHYLAESAPQNPRTVEGPPRTAARPTGPDDEDGWQRWAARYGGISTLLAGPNGDSGYGQEEAVREVRDRRLPPDTIRDEAPDPELDEATAADAPADDSPPGADTGPPGIHTAPPASGVGSAWTDAGPSVSAAAVAGAAVPGSVSVADPRAAQGVPGLDTPATPTGSTGGWDGPHDDRSRASSRLALAGVAAASLLTGRLWGRRAAHRAGGPTAS